MSSDLSATISLPNGNKVTVRTGLFIDNKWVPSVEGATIDSINPATEDVLATVACATAKDIDIAVKSSRKAFSTVWGRNYAPSERGVLLNKLADLMEANLDSLADLEAVDNGKSAVFARAVDVSVSVKCFRYYAGWADKIVGQTIEVDDKNSKSASTRIEPIGVCGQIVPWNYNLGMLSWKVAPALAAGCTVILKPSELSPLPALKFAELVGEAGFPPGVFNLVPALGHIGGAALSAHMDVDKVAFTGSTLTGRKIMAAAAQSNLKNVSLELGGKSPHIVFESANIKEAAKWGASAIFMNHGQDCSAGSRLYVQSSVYDAYITELVKHAEGWTADQKGPFGEASRGGPLISSAQRDKVAAYVDGAREAGAKIILGGQKPDKKGWYYPPTIIGEVTPDMKVVREEIFGPVVAVTKFETEEEVLRLANDTTYGLAAGFHSSDANQCQRVIAKLEAGTVFVNHYGVLYSQVPFGGYKQSGIGRDLGSYALENYTQVKSVLWDYSGGSA